MGSIRRDRKVIVVGDGTWLETSEAAQQLGVSDNTVRRYMAQGRLDEPVRPKLLPSGHRRIHKDSVARLKNQIEANDASTQTD
jgi:excisionase family DNA binding protein